jgi:hypothetical protein
MKLIVTRLRRSAKDREVDRDTYYVNDEENENKYIGNFIVEDGVFKFQQASLNPLTISEMEIIIAEAKAILFDSLFIESVLKINEVEHV